MFLNKGRLPAVRSTVFTMAFAGVGLAASDARCQEVPGQVKSAPASSNDEILQQLDAMKLRITELEAQLRASTAAAAAKASASPTVAPLKG